MKYLGVILDQKLKWVEHVKDKAQKALSAFWICRKAFGRNWGMPSKAVLWLYEAVVRPMMSHGCVVWWPRLNVGTAKKELGELQRLVCICVTGAMRSTATAAMETLMALPPIQMIVQAKAFATADRLTQNSLWMRNFDSGHGAIKRLISDRVFDMPRDRLVQEISFVKHYQVVIPERAEWLQGWPEGLPLDGRVGFTDGSKIGEATGAGVYAPELGCNESFHLGSLASVFQAETFAALRGVQKLVQSDETGEKAVICSDSESMIKALASPVTTSRLVKEMKGTLNQLELRNGS